MRALAVLAASVVFGWAAMSSHAGAQDGLTGVIMRGTSLRPGIAGPNTPTMLSRGVRVESPQRSWTEIAFSDGSSILLEPGADFTLQGIDRNPANGHLVIRGTAGRGRLRITTSDTVEVLLVTPTAQVRVVAASAIVAAGRGGSATMISGSRVVVWWNGREEVLRRPGFAVVFDGGIERESRAQLAQALDNFAPVTADSEEVEVMEATTPAVPSTGVAANARISTGLSANEGVSFQSETGLTNTGRTGGGPTGGGTTGGGPAGGGTAGVVPYPRVSPSFSIACSVISSGCAA
jgi:hypothetical protein